MNGVYSPADSIQGGDDITLQDQQSILKPSVQSLPQLIITEPPANRYKQDLLDVT